MTHYFGEIPETLRTKVFYPLGKNLWKLFKEFGYERILTFQDKSEEIVFEELQERLNTTLTTAKRVVENKISHPEQVLTYLLFPPVASIRTDLQQGTMKLLYGNSVDLSFIVMRDETQDIFFILSGHCEDGIPIDWWFTRPNDELLERRHSKIGLKLNELPRQKNFLQCGLRCLEILTDVRNERTPQWATSSSHVSPVWTSGLWNTLFERSGHEVHAALYDGCAADKVFGEPWFAYIPWPVMIKTLLMMKREDWVLRLTGLMYRHYLHWQGLEDIALNWLKSNFPEVYSYNLKIWDEGIPYPIQTLNSSPPDLKNPKVCRRQLFDWIYQYPEKFIRPKNVGMTIEEMLKGVFLNVTHETTLNEIINSSHIISTGTGLNTKIF
ncbi:MAG: hypothetical protein ACFFCM_05575 [Promethearchaeota archaeon]